MTKIMKTLYKKLDTGKIQTWTMELDGDKYRTISGQIDGKLVTSKYTTAIEKNTGKSNFVSAIEQARKEVDAKYVLKLKEGYFESIEEAGNPKIFEVMLAKQYTENVDKVRFPCYVDPKLDGIRCYITKDGMFTRKHRPIISCPHIFESCKEIFKQYPGIILDGELYNHDLKNDFNKIISMVRKTKPNLRDLKESEKLIQYHMYDIVYPGKDHESGLRFARLKDIEDLQLKHLHFISREVVFSTEELLQVHTKNTGLKYEGTIIRDLESPYIQKRTDKLLKLKDFKDDEFEIINILEGTGNRSSMMGEIVMVTKEGEKFSSNALGNAEYYTELLKNKKDYIGKFATVRFQDLTERGVPRFPCVVAIDRASFGDI